MVISFLVSRSYDYKKVLFEKKKIQLFVGDLSFFSHRFQNIIKYLYLPFLQYCISWRSRSYNQSENAGQDLNLHFFFLFL